jgi:hypothetical protein
VDIPTNAAMDGIVAYCILRLLISLYILLKKDCDCFVDDDEFDDDEFDDGDSFACVNVRICGKLFLVNLGLNF